MHWCLPLILFFFTSFYYQGGDDDYEFNPDDFQDPYTPEELAKYAADKEKAATEATATDATPVEGEK